MSYLLRQGTPANDVAIYLPTDDAWAGFKPGVAYVDQAMDGLLGPNVIPQVLNAGFNFDFMDDRAIAAGGVPYRVLILPGVERIPLRTLERLQTYVRGGGRVIATRRLPSRAPGFLEGPGERAQIAELARSVARLLPDEQSLGSTLAQMIRPDFATGSAARNVGFVHRALGFADIYFVANTSNQDVSTTAVVRMTGRKAEWWDAFTGEAKGAAVGSRGETSTVQLELAPYESRVLVFSNEAHAAQPSQDVRPQEFVDLSSGWKVAFKGMERTIQMDHLRSWTDDVETRYYSGEAAYEKSVKMPRSFPAGRRAVLNFGPGEMVAPLAGEAPGMRALLESPVREAALIYVNGEFAGSLWHPPYSLDISRFVHSGHNQVRITVANLAINEMAGRTLPDYKLLNLRYGVRFVPQGFDGLQPLPSGILGKVELQLSR